jgi:hypothetical protein
MISASKSRKLEEDREAAGDMRPRDQAECPTRLLEDTPAEDDLLAFSGDIGPHERVAQAIAEVILSPHESGGKMIGLEGGWGSGKTTVINLLRKHLDANPNITVVSFDAWAHEGDPLRRTFLETQIRHFQSITGWLTETENEEWSKKLLKLAKKQGQTNIRTVPKTNTLGTIFAISAFLVPIGLLFLQTSLSQGVTINPSLPISWEFVIGLVLTGAPLLVLLGKVILKRFIKKKNSRESSDKSKSEERDADDWAVLQGKFITETTQDITETPDPTSIEFEDIFRKLMQTVLPEESSRRAIIVLDNLDRIDPKDALSIWATLQTFLQDRSTKKEPWFSKLWIIVPYDPSGLRHLWASRRVVDEDTEKKDTEKKDTEKKVDELVVDRPSAEQTVTVSFIDKSFQLRFEVPPPVLSNWKAYLMKLVEEALPKHSNDRHMIYRVFDMCRTKGSNPPTPRELKLYVNQIGVIHRQWQDKFPIGHVAYYVILRRQNVNISKGLIEGTLPASNIVSIVPPNLRDNLAGLAYNVPAELGQQLTLNDPIYDALAKNDSTGLQKLEKSHGDGFWAVLEVVVTSGFADADATTVANAALCLDQSHILENQTRNETITVIGELKKIASGVDSWAPFNEGLSKGIAAACRIVLNLDFSKQLLEVLRRTILTLKKKEGEGPPAITLEVIAGITNVSQQVDEIDHGEALERPFVLPINKQDWIDVCSHIKTQNQKWWSLFLPEEKFDEVSQLLLSAVTKGQFLDKHLTAVQVTQESFTDNNWESLARSFEQRLAAEQKVNSEEANFLLQGLSLLRRFNCVSAKDASKRLADGGHLMHGLFLAQSQNNIECKARFIIAFLEQRPDAAMPQIVGNAAGGHSTLMSLLSTDDVDLAQQMLNILRDQNNLEILFSIVAGRNQYDPLVLRCLRTMADDTKSEILYKPQTLIERWKALRDHLNEDKSPARFDNLIRHLCERAALVEEVQKTEGEFQAQNAGLYLKICQASPSKSFCEWCRSGIEKMDANTWKTELDNEGDALKLMLTLIDKKMSVILKQQYQDALVVHAKSVLTGSVRPSGDLVLLWSKVLKGLGEGAARKVLRNRLRDAAMEQDGKCADVFFDMYGEEIAHKATLTGNKNIVAELFSPLVRERVIGGLRWLRDIFSINSGLLKKYNDESSVQDFRERLQGELGGSANKEDEAHNLIIEIANTLGISPKEEPPADGAVADGDTSGTLDGEEESAKKEKNEK